MTLDLVLDHMAAEHAWAVTARGGRRQVPGLLLRVPDRTRPDAFEGSLPEVFPEFAPGNFTWDDNVAGWVRTPFNAWQWDLNWSNPDVLCEFIAIILNKAERGCGLPAPGCNRVHLEAPRYRLPNQPEVRRAPR